MDFEEFKRRVNAMLSSIGIRDPMDFKHSDGKHYAYGNDITIIGNPIAISVQIRWGSGHSANVILLPVG